MSRVKKTDSKRLEGRQERRFHKNKRREGFSVRLPLKGGSQGEIPDSLQERVLCIVSTFRVGGTGFRGPILKLDWRSDNIFESQLIPECIIKDPKPYRMDICRNSQILPRVPFLGSLVSKSSLQRTIY